MHNVYTQRQWVAGLVKHTESNKQLTKTDKQETWEAVPESMKKVHSVE